MNLPLLHIIYAERFGLSLFVTAFVLALLLCATSISSCLLADVMSPPDLSSGQDFSSVKPDCADFFLNFKVSAIADQNNNETGRFSPISPAAEQNSKSSPCSGEAPQLDVVKRLTDIIPLPNFIDMIQCIFCHNPHHSPEQVTERLMT